MTETIQTSLWDFSKSCFSNFTSNVFPVSYEDREKLMGQRGSARRMAMFSAHFFFSAHFLTGLFILLILSCMSCLCILEINSLSVVSFAIISPHAEGCLFILFIVVFAVLKFWSLSPTYFCFLITASYIMS